MKKGFMMLFAVLLMACMVTAAFATVIWSDNFNDESLDDDWEELYTGYGYIVEQNDRIEMSPYLHYEGYGWMSAALQRDGDYALSSGRHTTIIIPKWYDVQEVTFVIHNNQYGSGEHDRYTIRWHNCWNDGTGTVHVDRVKDGQGASLYNCNWRNGHWGLPYYSPYNQWIYGRTVAVGMQIKHESSNDVHFWWGEHIIFKNAQGEETANYWDWWNIPVTDEGGDIDWIFSSNAVYIAFNTYNSHPDHELGVAFFDDFDIAAD